MWLACQMSRVASDYVDTRNYLTAQETYYELVSR